LASDGIAAALVENHQIVGSVHRGDGIHALPNGEIAPAIRTVIERVCAASQIGIDSLEAVGVGIAGIVREGVIEESPNLPQIKGLNLRGALELAGVKAPVLVLNDADAMAAGIAATRGQLEKLIRVWALGHGIGYGRYPQGEGVLEGGHMVVSLDPKEQYCGCGGTGHLEGIMGYRAMRMRFLDLEPEEVFEEAGQGDARCTAFVKLWHRALAAGTASCVHLDGPGKFYISGSQAKYIDISLVGEYLHEMVKMTPLQGSVFEVVPTSEETAIIGAAVNAGLAAAH
jgi:predicted NBD/HSP70 family sugar kinase